MATFKFVTIGENLGTRVLGEKVRNMLLPMILGNEKVVLDFEGVNLAKLLLSMPLEELKRRTTFRGVNNFVRKNIAVAFKRRMLIMKA